VNVLRGELSSLRDATDHLSNDLRLLAARLDKDEASAQEMAMRNCQVLGQLAHRLAELDHLGTGVREALEAIEKDVTAQASELDRLSATLSCSAAPGPGRDGEVSRAEYEQRARHRDDVGTTEAGPK
jgi:uncharacterized coiled-coil protein SlyX